MRSFQTDICGARLRYVDITGTGLPLIFIHGLGGASSFDYPLVVAEPALRGRHVVLIDLLGFGYSDRPDDFGYGVGDHARLILQFLNACYPGPIDLYGHSMGGAVAIEVATALGSRVEHLILAEANLDKGGGMGSRMIAARSEADWISVGQANLIKASREGEFEPWSATLRASSPIAVHRGARSLIEGGAPDWRTLLYAHPAARTYIFGERSLPAEDVEVLAANGISVAIVPGAGHAICNDNPVGLAAVIAEALN